MPQETTTVQTHLEFVIPLAVMGERFAGTATKMVLNMRTTGTLMRLGKTYDNLRIDLNATNAKL